MLITDVSMAVGGLKGFLIEVTLNQALENTRVGFRPRRTGKKGRCKQRAAEQRRGGRAEERSVFGDGEEAGRLSGRHWNPDGKEAEGGDMGPRQDAPGSAHANQRAG